MKNLVCKKLKGKRKKYARCKNLKGQKKSEFKKKNRSKKCELRSKRC